jgi:Flp pilus assembly protein CpaB
MFALTLALLAGLGAVVAARYAGWLGKPEAPPPAKAPDVKVLVAARNLFPGDMIDSSYVQTLTLRSDERAAYEKEKDQYLPPVPGAAAQRVASKPIEADSPILRKDLKEMAKPDALNLRLLPNMRAVNVSLSKDQSAGGLIQVGEWVDVYLTSSVSVGEQETTRTAPVARSLRIIVKRNVLWNVFAGLPDNKPVHFTLEANPYRAALLEFSKTKGSLTLVPLSAAEQRILEDRRGKLLAQREPRLLPISFAVAAPAEVSAEETRVDQFNKGEYTVSTADLVRLFDLTTPPPPRTNVVVEHFSGLNRTQFTHFGPDGEFLRTENMRGNRTRARAGQLPNGKGVSSFQFNPPDGGKAGGGKNCARPKST